MDLFWRFLTKIFDGNDEHYSWTILIAFFLGIYFIYLFSKKKNKEKKGGKEEEEEDEEEE